MTDIGLASLALTIPANEDSRRAAAQGLLDLFVTALERRYPEAYSKRCHRPRSLPTAPARTELRESLAQLSQKPLSLRPVLEPHDE